MRSWTRTLNLDDAHVLLDLARPGKPVLIWDRDCRDALSHLSVARQRELIRIVREEFLDVTDDVIDDALFLRSYTQAGRSDRHELVRLQWALTHPLALLAAEQLVHPALDSGRPQIQLGRIDTFVAEKLTSSSTASRTKTRTVLVGALEGVGCLGTQGTGRNRTLWARRGKPSDAARRFLEARGGPGLVIRLTACSSLR